MLPLRRPLARDSRRVRIPAKKHWLVPVSHCSAERVSRPIPGQLQPRGRKLGARLAQRAPARCELLAGGGRRGVHRRQPRRCAARLLAQRLRLLRMQRGRRLGIGLGEEGGGCTSAASAACLAAPSSLEQVMQEQVINWQRSGMYRAPCGSGKGGAPAPPPQQPPAPGLPAPARVCKPSDIRVRHELYVGQP